ncbi:MAG: GNAT family N-acetyltransferase [Myxococcota bacterium]
MAVLSIVRAFVADPLVRWFFPDDETYVQRASTFFGLLFDGRVDDGNVHVARDGAAVSMWDPPGGGSIAQDELDRRWVAEFEPGAGPGESERLEAYEAAAEALMPLAASWYLGVLATDPDRQRQGLASAAIAPVLEWADHDRVTTYLETGAPENLTFYARAGFEVIDAVVLPGGPTLWGLQRSPVGQRPVRDEGTGNERRRNRSN